MADHPELVSANNFSSKFKRALLNYYSYGFREASSYGETQKKDWKRLNSIIYDYLEWSEKNSNVNFACADSLAMYVNPFHRLYRFCRFKSDYPAYFILAMSALSKGIIELRETDEFFNRFESESFRKRYIAGELKTSDLIEFYTDKLVSLETDNSNRNKTPNDRLGDLAHIGFLKCIQREGENGGVGDRYWSLPEITVKEIISIGKKADESFETHFVCALIFFSHYFPLGEIGTYLIERVGNDSLNSYSFNPFAFKHEYFMQSLNDFTLFDLLYAIENKKWCKIKYSHITDDFEAEFVCFPIEIRVSSIHGREYLMYYEPFKRVCSSLRLEFIIDPIEYLDSDEIINIVTKYNLIDENELKSDLENCASVIKKSWGVSCSNKAIYNDKIKTRDVRLKIRYDRQKESYIKSRLLKEKRIGEVKEDIYGNLEFCISVIDERELRPWIRSFYGRIISCKGMEREDFSIPSDVDNMLAALNSDNLNDKKIVSNNRLSNSEASKWGIPSEIEIKKAKKAAEHDKLYNEAFSVYYFIIANVFTQLSAREESFTSDEFEKAIFKSMSLYSLQIGEKTEHILPDEIKELLLSKGFLKETQKLEVEENSGSIFKRKKIVDSNISRFKCGKNDNMYRDIVPLSEAELRWLKIIIEDDKIKLFLSKEEVNSLRLSLNSAKIDLKPLDMEKIIHYDKLYVTDERVDADIFKTLVKAVYNRKLVNITYVTLHRKTTMDGLFKPIKLEFSLRDNTFRAKMQSIKNERIYTMIISRIEKISETQIIFDYLEAEKAFDDYRKAESEFVEVAFFDENNMADRILTEFSPWKKECTYDKEKGIYRLKIYYQKSDITEITIRLMGYGAYIYFDNKNDKICKEIKNRILDQREIITKFNK